MYIENLKYILEHKKNVFIECIKLSKELKGKNKLNIIIHAFTHDLSKLSFKEFKPYTMKFFGGKHLSRQFLELMSLEDKCISQEEVNENFNIAWEHHYKNNKHHWNYWIGQDMPYKYIIQMICDWKGMSRKFGDTAQEFYLKNYKKMDLSWRTRMDIELILNLNLSDAYNYGHTMEQFAKMYDKETYDIHFGFTKDKYGIDSYELLK